MITVCILTKNAEKTLKATLDSVRSFPEVLILDTGSSDQTLTIAKQYPNVTIHKTPFSGFGLLRNQIASFAKNEWILALDSDEILSDELIVEILQKKKDSSDSYAINRHNFYRGKRIYGCGWNPDRVSRLYHRQHTRFSEADVHESLESKRVKNLHFPILHTPYRTTEDFLAKMQHYSSLFAKQYKGKRSSSFGKACIHGLFSFFRSYFLKRGFLDGKEGFIISLYNANTSFYKYLKLWEATESCNK
jgi:glycosyltransferase involved in cell wall biosynthesis